MVVVSACLIFGVQIFCMGQCF